MAISETVKHNYSSYHRDAQSMFSQSQLYTVPVVILNHSTSPFLNYLFHSCALKQESGRAGRDGEKAQCIVFWRFADLTRQSTMVFTEQTGLENLYGLVSYCLDGVRYVYFLWG